MDEDDALTAFLDIALHDDAELRELRVQQHAGRQPFRVVQQGVDVEIYFDDVLFFRMFIGLGHMRVAFGLLGLLLRAQGPFLLLEGALGGLQGFALFGTAARWRLLRLLLDSLSGLTLYAAYGIQHLLGFHEHLFDGAVVAHDVIHQCRLSEERRGLEDMQFVELHSVQTQFHAHGRLEAEGLVLFPSNQLHGKMLQVVEHGTVEGLQQLLGVGLDDTLPAQMPCGALTVGKGGADIVVGVVDEICLETCVSELASVFRHESQAYVQQLTALALLRLWLVSDGAVGRVIPCIIL